MRQRGTIGRRASAVIALCALSTVGSPAQTFTTLASFDGPNGEGPNGLVQATNGDLYGTTQDGGTNNKGTVFKITPGGSLTTVYSFCPQVNCTGGELPEAGLVQATSGDLYGTTVNGSGADIDGTVFKVSLGGELTTLYSFCLVGNCLDGAGPYARLVQGIHGDLYGTTVSGGAKNDGTVFRVTPGGTLTTLYSFCSVENCGDGATPFAGLVQATNGDFYGTTTSGGVNNKGTVFKMTPGGKLTTLYNFCSVAPNCADGANPSAGLIEAANGDLYGTTVGGGAYNSGTVFEITLSGKLTTLYNFCSLAPGCADGSSPGVALVRAANGDLYGTTDYGGAYDAGTVFEITLSGALTTLHSFCPLGCADGAIPIGLVQATNGDLYGTTAIGGGKGACHYGGVFGCGTIFRLSLGLGPFVESLPTAGKIGSAVKILGTGLTAATSVTFNGTAAAFTVASPTLITTNVPAGATSGEIQVIGPKGELSSNVPFRVLQ